MLHAFTLKFFEQGGTSTCCSLPLRGPNAAGSMCGAVVSELKLRVNTSKQANKKQNKKYIPAQPHNHQYHHLHHQNFTTNHTDGTAQEQRSDGKHSVCLCVRAHHCHTQPITMPAKFSHVSPINTEVTRGRAPDADHQPTITPSGFGSDIIRTGVLDLASLSDLMLLSPSASSRDQPPSDESTTPRESGSSWQRVQQANGATTVLTHKELSRMAPTLPDCGVDDATTSAPTTPRESDLRQRAQEENGATTVLTHQALCHLMSTLSDLSVDDATTGAFTTPRASHLRQWAQEENGATVLTHQALCHLMSTLSDLSVDDTTSASTTPRESFQRQWVQENATSIPHETLARECSAVSDCSFGTLADTFFGTGSPTFSSRLSRPVVDLDAPSERADPQQTGFLAETPSAQFNTNAGADYVQGGTTHSSILVLSPAMNTANAAGCALGARGSVSAAPISCAKDTARPTRSKDSSNALPLSASPDKRRLCDDGSKSGDRKRRAKSGNKKRLAKGAATRNSVSPAQTQRSRGPVSAAAALVFSTSMNEDAVCHFVSSVVTSFRVEGFVWDLGKVLAAVRGAIQAFKATDEHTHEPLAERGERFFRLSAAVFILRFAIGHCRQSLQPGGSGAPLKKILRLSDVIDHCFHPSERVHPKTLATHLKWFLGYTSFGSGSGMTWNLAVEDFEKAKKCCTFFHDCPPTVLVRAAPRFHPPSV